MFTCLLVDEIILGDENRLNFSPYVSRFWMKNRYLFEYFLINKPISVVKFIIFLLHFLLFWRLDIFLHPHITTSNTKHVRAGSVNDVCKAYKTGFTNLKLGNIKGFV